jgi:hypothetical protein
LRSSPARVIVEAFLYEKEIEMKTIEDKLATYLMSHGVLKNADASKMAKKIVGMVGKECDELRDEIDKQSKQLGTCSICGYIAWKEIDRDNEQCQVCQLTKERDELRAKLGQLTRIECDTRRELVAHREKAQDNYWAWQGDGEDHLESLACPVLIPTKSLQEILDRCDRAEAAGAAYKHVIQLAWEDRRDDSDVEYIGKLAEARCNGDQCGKGWLSPEKKQRLREALKIMITASHKVDRVRGWGKILGDATKAAKQALADTEDGK